MIRLAKSLAAWKTPFFETVLKEEVEQMDAAALPLQQGLSRGSYASAEHLSVMILRISDGPDFIHARIGVQYGGIIAGCSCADDPTPVGEHAEYCEIRLEIDKTTAQARVWLVTD